MEKKNRAILIILLLILGFAVRSVISMHTLVGDINAFAEWGRRFWEVGARNFYSSEGWYYTFPTQPPLASLTFAFINWLSDQHVFAQLHNTFKFPAAAAVFFGKVVPLDPFMHTYEYYYFLKLLPIVSDLILALIIYNLIYRFTGSYKKALVAFAVYLFNPISIFLSGIWGQIESTVAVFGILSFVFVYFRKIYLSIPLFFICLYLKPTWAHLIPFYLLTLSYAKPRLKDLVVGLLSSFAIFIVSTYPFSGTNFIGFTIDTIINNMLPSAKGTGKLSVSAFNFYTIFWAIDIVFTNFLSKLFSLFSYVILNVLAFSYYKRTKDKFIGMMVGVFVVALGSFLFMDNMLERYFFPAFVPMILLMSLIPGLAKKIVVINGVLFLTLFYSFFRRFSDEISHPFVYNNYVLIRMLSLVSVAFFLNVSARIVIQSKRG